MSCQQFNAISNNTRRNNALKILENTKIPKSQINSSLKMSIQILDTCMCPNPEGHVITALCLKKVEGKPDRVFCPQLLADGKTVCSVMGFISTKKNTKCAACTDTIVFGSVLLKHPIATVSDLYSHFGKYCHPSKNCYEGEMATFKANRYSICGKCTEPIYSGYAIKPDNDISSIKKQTAWIHYDCSQVLTL